MENEHQNNRIDGSSAQPLVERLATHPSGQIYKVCPTCSQPAVLNMAVCGRCGYRYQPRSGTAGQGAASAAAFPAATLYQMSASGSPVVNLRESGNRGRVPFGLAAGALLGLFALSLFLIFGRSSGVRGGSVAGGSSGMQIVPSGSLPAGAGFIGGLIDPQQIDQRLVQAGAAMGGDLEISLAWNTLTDLDLSARDPSGELIWAKHRDSASGGVQDVDANSTPLTMEGYLRVAAGENPGPENVLPLPESMVDQNDMFGLKNLFPGSSSFAPSKFTHTPVEHIYFAHAPRGTYTVYASCYWWREPNRNPLPFTILVRSHGKVSYETVGTLGPACYVTDNTGPIQVLQFVIR